MHIFIIRISFLILFIPLFGIQQGYSQNQDSILEKINNIDIALEAPPDSVENLYLNAVSFQSFYDLLAPVGEWIQISKEEIDEELGDGDGQGFASNSNDESIVFIWRPTFVDEGWKPYSNGNWTYTDKGWVWQANANEHWGWATYHYGRWWHSEKNGWVWMPGYVWAPAWVEWRVADGHVGWAPLSPRAKWKIESGITDVNYKYKAGDADWVFIEKSKFADEIGRNNITAADQNSKLLKGSKTVLNIKAENDAIVHSGPDVKEIEKVSGKNLQEKKIRFVNDKAKIHLTTGEISLYKEPIKRYKNREVKRKIGNKERPKIYKKTKKVKILLKKKKSEHRNKIRRHHL